jgi:hypothetical protein
MISVGVRRGLQMRRIKLDIVLEESEAVGHVHSRSHVNRQSPQIPPVGPKTDLTAYLAVAAAAINAPHATRTDQ